MANNYDKEGKKLTILTKFYKTHFNLECHDKKPLFRSFYIWIRPAISRRI